MMEITIVAHVQTEGQSEQIVDLGISELIDFELARDFQVKNILGQLGYTDVQPLPTEDVDVFKANAQLNGQAVQPKILFGKALKAGNVGSKSGVSFYELNELRNVVHA